ncbi:MAG TPA: glycosyltransferase [Vitreimonas sp.]|nr:glycosyltransferase [Vitreimonas sp.]
MRIAFFTDTFFPAHNGVLSSVVNFANGLVMAGHQVLICAPRHPQAQSMEWGLLPEVKVCLVRALPLPVYPDYCWMMPTPGLFEKLDEFQPDIIHTHSPLIAGWIGLRYAKKHHLPIVTSYNVNFTNQELIKILRITPMKVTRLIHKPTIKAAAKFYQWHNLVLVPTLSVKESLTPAAVDSQVCPIPVPVTELQAARGGGQILRQSLNAQPRLLYVGRLSLEKNLDALLQVFAAAHQLLPALELVIIGDGPLRSQLETRAEELGIKDQVRFKGAIPYKKLITEGWFYVGDVFITMSKCETQGLSTVEAMACGLPVIAAQAEGNTDVVAGAGLLLADETPASVAKQIVELVTDTKLYRHYQQLSRIRAAEYSLATCTQRLITLYSDLLSR